MPVQPPLLDRAADLRTDDEVLSRLRDDPATRTVVVCEGRLRVHDGALTRVNAGEVARTDDAEWAVLGRDRDGAPLLLAAVPAMTDSLDAAPDETWLGLRDVGGRLDEHEGELFVTAVALSAWLSDASYCPACGAQAVLRQAGWSRQCPACGREHFPRTDPAVIVAVESPDGKRLLLGANANWRGRMYSCFAGFVEAGESLEQTIHRELEEEAGVRLRDIHYIASQPWPYPRSLMVGFRAVADDEQSARPDGEEILDVRWFTHSEIGDALAGRGEVGLPGPASIARRLIVQWHRERA